METGDRLPRWVVVALVALPLVVAIGGATTGFGWAAIIAGAAVALAEVSLAVRFTALGRRQRSTSIAEANPSRCTTSCSDGDWFPPAAAVGLYAAIPIALGAMSRWAVYGKHKEGEVLVGALLTVWGIVLIALRDRAGRVWARAFDRWERPWIGPAAVGIVCIVLGVSNISFGL